MKHMGEVLHLPGGFLQRLDVDLPEPAYWSQMRLVEGHHSEAHGIFSGNNVSGSECFPPLPGTGRQPSSAVLGEKQALCDGLGNPDGTNGLEITQGQGPERMREEQGKGREWEMKGNSGFR